VRDGCPPTPKKTKDAQPPAASRQPSFLGAGKQRNRFFSSVMVLVHSFVDQQGFKSTIFLFYHFQEAHASRNLFCVDTLIV
jgi:hypothetical protein